MLKKRAEDVHDIKIFGSGHLSMYMGAGAIVMDVIATNDGRRPHERIERIRQLLLGHILGLTKLSNSLLF